jgi:putative ABC transport system permease protein
MLMRLIARVRSMVGRRQIDAEAAEELAFHLEHETQANVARGMTTHEARRVALITLGGAAQTLEAVRDVRATSLDRWWRDFRHACRSLRATPSFTIVALAVSTLSIGASTAIFSVVDGVLLRPLPFADADRLVAVGELDLRNRSEQDVDRRVQEAGGDDLHRVAPQNFLDWHAQQRVFTGLAAIGYASLSLKAEPGQEPETLTAQAVTADFFPVLGAAPLIGRTFTADHEVDGRARVAVISYGLWQRRFGGSPDVIGRSLKGQLADFEILGVMPPSFAYPVGAIDPTDVWLPNVFRPEDRVRGDDFSYRLQVIGRLRDGTSLEQAQAQMDRITAGLARETPRWFEHRVAYVEPLHEYITRGVRRWMLMLLGAVGFMLLIACVNLANLTLVRASARARDLVIRAALGASRWDLARGLLVESLLLSLGGAVLGTIVAALGLEALRAAIPPEVPRVAAIAIDLRVLAATVLVAVASGLLFGAAPLVQVGRGSQTPVTRTDTANRMQHWMRAGLVVSEVACALVLLVGSGLFIASFARVASVDLGLDPRHVLTVRVRPLVGPKNWALAQQRHPGLLRDLVADVRAIPGVEVAALVQGGVPLRGDLRTTEFAIPGRELPPGEDLDFNQISPDYFRALRVPLLDGRSFTGDDRQGSEPVVIINRAAAQRYFPGENPIGKTVQFLGVRRIVGVVGNIRHDGPEAGWRRQGFVPLEQSQQVGATLVLRLSRSARDVLPAVKAAIWSQFPDVALPDVETLSGYLGRLTAQRRFLMLLFSLLGLLGAVITCVGIYGVMAYVVELRTHEIGIRIALGARPGVILSSILGQALTYLGAGLAIGLPGAWLLGALVAGFLFQVEPHDVRIYGWVMAALVTTGIAAALFPARRAARVDPLVALRD